MNRELLAMQLVQDKLFNTSRDSVMLSGASQDELLKRFEILNYGFHARTRTALATWSKQLIEAIGEQEWNQLGLEFIEQHAVYEPQIGRLALLFFQWLKSKSLSKVAFLACERDESFYLSQNNFFSESKLLENPQLLLQVPICLQESTILIESQSLVVSRDRQQFYTQKLAQLEIQVLKKLNNQYVLLDSLLDDCFEQDKLVEFLVVGIQKKWFQKEFS
tara:strand:- start:55563 stop:56219 length:657 start_codon:yes stop_codon:yes gene_type:complete